MKKLLMVLSFAGLAFTMVPSILVLYGTIELEDHFLFMIIGMVLWFATAPFWMKGTSLDEVEE